MRDLSSAHLHYFRKSVEKTYVTATPGWTARAYSGSPPVGWGRVALDFVF